MYEVFDKDNNGVVDLEQFVKSFQVCDEKILQVLNTLIEKQDMFLDKMKDWYLFSNFSLQHGF